MIAFIPARSGSQRIPGKNTRLLAGHPLLAYSIRAAIDSGVFERVVVSSDAADILDVAYRCGVSTHHRLRGYGSDDPDVIWVRDVLTLWPCESFAILRPTSPFRTAETIRRASRLFTAPDQTADTLRAVRKVREHPGKMWVSNAPPGYEAAYPIKPLLTGKLADGTPWHSAPTQALPTYYVQTASLEMAHSYVVTTYGTITGRKILPFFTEGVEAFDLNTEDDWAYAEWLIGTGRATLPAMALAAQTAGVEAPPAPNPGRPVAVGGRV